MDLRRERKRSLKVREQQEAKVDRIEASKKRYARLYSRLRLKILHDNLNYYVIIVDDAKRQLRPWQPSDNRPL